MNKCQCILKTGPRKGLKCLANTHSGNEFCKRHKACVSARPESPERIIPWANKEHRKLIRAFYKKYPKANVKKELIPYLEEVLSKQEVEEKKEAITEYAMALLGEQELKTGALTTPEKNYIRKITLAAKPSTMTINKLIRKFAEKYNTSLEGKRMAVRRIITLILEEKMFILLSSSCGKCANSLQL